jgi:exodeoxyribonuclease-3
MKLIQWNSQCSFRTKNSSILEAKPDILVVCECENEDRLKFGELTPQPTGFIWKGGIKHKGIGIFSYSDWKLEVHPSYNSEFKFVIPIIATNGNQRLNLLAVWTQGSNGKIRYIEHLWCALDEYAELLDENTIIIGDFNSNVQWDDNGYIGNHSEVVEKLKSLKIQSLYHFKHGLPQGNEPEPTFFMYRHVDKPFHIDYCFASEALLTKDFNVEIGKHEDWCDLSDHVPMIIDL